MSFNMGKSGENFLVPDRNDAYSEYRGKWIEITAGGFSQWGVYQGTELIGDVVNVVLNPSIIPEYANSKESPALRIEKEMPSRIKLDSIQRVMIARETHIMGVVNRSQKDNGLEDISEFLG